jgi:probable phosphoglycerate mutase
MLELYVARHGQDVDNQNGILNGHRDEPLTPLGEEQARTVAGEIRTAGLRFDHVYASPLQRAFKTAEIIARESGQPEPIKEDLLIERDFGVMTGEPISRIEELCAPDIIKTDTITYFLDPEGGETFPHVLERAVKLLASLRSKHTDGKILLVTHGDLGKMLYAYFYDLPWQQVLTDFHFGNSEILYLAEGADLKKTRLFTSTQFNQ